MVRAGVVGTNGGEEAGGGRGAARRPYILILIRFSHGGREVKHRVSVPGGHVDSTWTEIRTDVTYEASRMMTREHVPGSGRGVFVRT